MAASPEKRRSVIGFNGHAINALLTSTYLVPEMHILTLRIASRHTPEAGAVALSKFVNVDLEQSFSVLIHDVQGSSGG